MSVRRPRGETGILRGLGGPSGEGSGKEQGMGEEGFIGEDLGKNPGSGEEVTVVQVIHWKDESARLVSQLRSS